MPENSSPESTSYRGRFAPSPTGPLHFGSLLAAVASFLRARACGGTWLIRMEDLDPPREVPGAARHILRTLGRFGLVSDEPVLWQSRRHNAYEQALARLEAGGVSFGCNCTRRQLQAHSIYPGTCAGVPPSAGRSIRVQVPDRKIAFEDLLQGAQSSDLGREIGAFVVRRADGLVAYQLAVVVDDIFQQVTEVVRGVDLLDSTTRQIYLYELLGEPAPRYLHIPVIVDHAGRKWSKQQGAPALELEDSIATLGAALHALGQDVPKTRNLQLFWGEAVQRFRLSCLRGHKRIAPEMGMTTA